MSASALGIDKCEAAAGRGCDGKGAVEQCVGAGGQAESAYRNLKSRIKTICCGGSDDVWAPQVRLLAATVIDGGL